jgi:hypothetical protein
MKQTIALFLSAALVSSTVACQRDPKAKYSENPTSTNAALVSQGGIPAGTAFTTDLQQEISTGKNRNNDRFTLKVKGGLADKNPALKDAQIEGHLEGVTKAERGKKAKLTLVFDAVKLKNGERYPIDATLVNTQVETKTKGKFLQNVGIVLVGATAGKFLGDKANFKQGAMAGGAAAAAYVLSSPGGEVVLKKGTDVKLKLKTPLKPS